MRSKLSYYSVLLLAGLAIVSVFVFAMNPFNGAPASASPATSAASGNSLPASNGAPALAPAGNASGLQPAGSFGGEHHHHRDEGFGSGGVTGNSTTTATVAVYSQNA